MKNYIWVLLCGVTGLVGYWIGRKSNEAKMREELYNEVQELKKYYKSRIQELEAEKKGFLNELGVPLKEVPKPVQTEEELKAQTPGGQQYRMVSNMQRKQRLDEIAKRYQDQDFKDMDEDQESDDEEEEDLYSEEELVLNHPYVISAEEYHEEKDWYDKEEFDFYQKDAALVNDQEEIILNWEDEIGEDALAILLTIEPKDVHEVYVRNDQESTDYLITVKPGSASELGFVPIGREG